MGSRRLPESLRFWRVDEVIECLELGKDRSLVERELLKMMLNAYKAPTVKMGTYGPEGPVEPDSHKEYDLSRIWSKLSSSTQLAISEAARKLD